MFNFFREIYLSTFIILCKAGGWDLRTNRAASSAVIALIESGVLMGVASLSDAFLGTKFMSNIPKWIICVAYLAICAFNHYLLIVRGNGITFEREFTHFKKSKRVLLMTCSVMMILAAIAFFLYSASVHRKLINHS
jgi:hypothetical protein